KRLALRLRLQVPQPQRRIVPRGEGMTSAGGESDSPRDALVPTQQVQLLAAADVPQPHRPVHATREGTLTVRGHSDTVHATAVRVLEQANLTDLHPLRGYGRGRRPDRDHLPVASLQGDGLRGEA